MAFDYERYEKTVTVGCVNYSPIWGDKAANLQKISGMVSQAAMQGVNILAFPELALSGYECSEGACMHRELAETIPGPATEELSRISKEYNIYVIVGMPERDDTNADICYIACALLGPAGFIGKYRKVHIAPPPLFTETNCFQGGDSVPVFETRYGPIGIQICADFWVFPELSRILTLKGALIIFNCCASMDAPGRPYYMAQQTGARATENLVFAASANLVGKEKNKSYYGHSTIAGPAFLRFSHIYAQGEDKEEIVCATLNFVQLHKFRELIPLEKFRRSRLILEELKSIEGEPSAK